MLKHKSKILVLAIISLLFINTCSFAEEVVTTTTDTPVVTDTATDTTAEDTATNNSVENAIPQQAILSDDQYLFGDNITMDKLVDANVYIIGKNVTISGRIAGNLFVIADKVTFTPDSIVQYSAFVSAKDVEFNGAAYDLYSFSENIKFGTTALIGRDFRTLSNSVDLKGIIVRNAIVASPNITLPAAATSTEDVLAGNSANYIYGSLIYYSNNELQVPEGFVQTGTFFNKLPNIGLNKTNTVMTYVTGALTFILFTLFLYGALYLRKNNNSDATKELIKSKILPIFGYGALALIVLIIAGLGFSLANITLPIGLLLFAILLFAIFISLPFTTIAVANVLSDKLPIAKPLIVLILSIVVWALTLIPYFNILVYVVAILFTLGYFLISNYFNSEKVEKNVEVKKEVKE